MDIEISIDNDFITPKIIIKTSKITPEVDNIIKKLNENNYNILCGFIDDKVQILNQNDIISIYSNDGKTFALTSNKEYRLKQRLYELEELLDKRFFVRISKSEIINLKMIDSLDLNFIGTIYVKFKNGTNTYVSRRYVKKIKEILGI